MSARRAISNNKIKNYYCIDFLQLVKGKDTNANNDKLSKKVFILVFASSPLKTIPTLKSTFCAVLGSGSQHHGCVTGCQPHITSCGGANTVLFPLFWLHERDDSVESL